MRIEEISFFDDENRINSGDISACAFTGHRNVLREHVDTVRQRLARAVAYAYAEGARTFYTGGAVGFDTLAAREVLRFRLSHPDVRLTLLLPCPEQDALWSDSQRDSYGYILANADSVEYVSEVYTKTCMKARNERLAELGDILIAYLYRTGTGSSQTVRLATKLGKKVYNIAPQKYTEVRTVSKDATETCPKTSEST